MKGLKKIIQNTAYVLAIPALIVVVGYGPWACNNELQEYRRQKETIQKYVEKVDGRPGISFEDLSDLARKADYPMHELYETDLEKQTEKVFRHIKSELYTEKVLEQYKTEAEQKNN